jgi:hypothetical protein
MTKISDVKKLLAKHDYEITLSITPKGCAADYPARLISPMVTATEVAYNINPKGVNEVEFPRYAIRTAIVLDVYRNCEEMQYDARCIVFLVHGEEVDEAEFLSKIPITLSEEEIVLEKSLVDVFTKAAAYGFSQPTLKLAKEAGVEEGYMLFKRYFGAGTTLGENE